MQHVRIGQNIACVQSCPVTLGDWRVTIKCGCLDVGKAEICYNTQLISGKRLRWRDVQDRAALEHSGECRQQISERLAGSRPGGNDHIPACITMFGRGRLVFPRRGDTGLSEVVHDRIGDPAGPTRGPTRPGGYVLDVGHPAAAHAIRKQPGRGRAVALGSCLGQHCPSMIKGALLIGRVGVAGTPCRLRGGSGVRIRSGPGVPRPWWVPRGSFGWCGAAGVALQAFGAFGVRWHLRYLSMTRCRSGSNSSVSSTRRGAAYRDFV